MTKLLSSRCPQCNSENIGQYYTVARPDGYVGAEIGVCYDCGERLRYENGVLSVIPSKETIERLVKNVQSL